VNEESVSTPEDGSARHPRPAATPFYAEPDGISLLDLAIVFLRQRRTILAFSLVLPVLVVAFSGLQSRTWTATASFIPQATTDASGASLSSLSNLAGQFGVSLGGGQVGQTPQFYADLLQSREVLGALASDTFVVMDSTGFFARGEIRGSLADFLEVEAEDPAPLRRAAVIRWLREGAVSVSTDRETSVVELSVQTAWPELSEQIATIMVDLVLSLIHI